MKKSKFKSAIPRIFMLFFAATAILCLSGCGTTKINLNKYISVTFSGYDGYGDVEIDFDDEAFVKDYGKKIKLTEAAENFGIESVADLVYDFYDYTVDPDYNLSNGDKVTVTWDTYRSDISGFVKGKVKFICDDTTVKVSGLEKVKSADIFEYVTVSFAGTEENIQAAVSVSGGLSPYAFSLDQTTGLKEGDTVTVTISESSVEGIIDATGTKPKSMTKEYKVKDVEYYPAINLPDYFKISYEGYDGIGTASVTFDEQAFEEDYGSVLELSSDAYAGGYTSIAYWFADNISGNVTPYSDLSNGDTITITWSFFGDISLNTSGNVVLSEESGSYTDTVSGLDAVEEVDLSEYVTVEFSGTAPGAKASLVVSDGLSSSMFSMESSSGTLSYNGQEISELDIGDVVTVTVSEEDINTIIENTGTKPASLSQDFTVDGVGHYAQNMDEIPDDAFEKMESQASDVFNTYVSSQWIEDRQILKSFTYLGDYFLYRKSYADNKHINVIVLVYEFEATQDGDDLSGIWFCIYYNAHFLDDGTFTMDYDDYTVPSWLENDIIFTIQSSNGVLMSYNGYPDIDTMFNKLMVPNLETFNYETSIE